MPFKAGDIVSVKRWRYISDQTIGQIVEVKTHDLGWGIGMATVYKIHFPPDGRSPGCYDWVEEVALSVPQDPIAALAALGRLQRKPRGEGRT